MVDTTEVSLQSYTSKQKVAKMKRKIGFYMGWASGRESWCIHIKPSGTGYMQRGVGSGGRKGVVTVKNGGFITNWVHESIRWQACEAICRSLIKKYNE